MSEFRFEKDSHPKIAFAAFAAILSLALVIGGIRLASEIRTLKLELASTEKLIERAKQERSSELPIAVYATATAEEARALFQNDVQSLADANELDVETLNPEDMVIVDGLVRIVLVVKGSVPENSLPSLLIAVQEAEPTLLLNAISLRRPRGRASPQVAPRLPIRLEFAAYARV
ncbi:MAG: GspMb/PilO family protein [Pseudomonadota bacterium]